MRGHRRGRADPGERADEGHPEAVVRVPGAGQDLRQGEGPHERLPLCQVQGERLQDVLG